MHRVVLRIDVARFHLPEGTGTVLHNFKHDKLVNTELMMTDPYGSWKGVVLGVGGVGLPVCRTIQ
jgi:hypothetical protein